MWLARVEKPNSLAVDVEEVARFLRIDISNEELASVSNLIMAATDVVENYTQRSLLTQKWELGINVLPSRIRLPRPPVQKIEKIEVGTFVVDSSSYKLYDENMLVCSFEMSNVNDDIVVTYVAGYGESEDIPSDIRQAIVMLAGYMYENREGSEVLPAVVKELLSPYKVLKV